jgi:hypothetical protein
MSQSNSEVGTIVEFGSERLIENARIYKNAKRLVDAASSCDSLDDAIAILMEAWGVLERQSEEGGGYTPDKYLGFGSDSAAVIADKLLGRNTTVGATRKSFANMGK